MTKQNILFILAICLTPTLVQASGDPGLIMMAGFSLLSQIVILAFFLMGWLQDYEQGNHHSKHKIGSITFLLTVVVGWLVFLNMRGDAYVFAAFTLLLGVPLITSYFVESIQDNRLSKSVSQRT
jgi:dolichyl-phosphate-mannose--protein O-mannosyl transferase